MSTYTVRMPFTGMIEIEVEADSEDQAKEKFFEEFDACGGLEKAMSDHHGEWDFHDKVIEGNVWYGTLSEVEIEQID